MLDNIRTENILFLDIETVPAFSEYSELPRHLQLLWDEKAASLSGRYQERVNGSSREIGITTSGSAQNVRGTLRENKTPEELYERAGIYAEFGKIICISAGYIKPKRIMKEREHDKYSGKHDFRTSSFYGDDEKELLNRFVQLLNEHYNKPHHLLCAHNGKEFDFPYLARRILINGLKLPAILDIAGKKPWEVAHLDTMEMWKFGDYKKYTSLNLLAAIFGIATPKDDIDGSDVARVYWKENCLDRIVNYCQKDVLTVAQLFLRFKGEPMIVETIATT